MSESESCFCRAGVGVWSPKFSNPGVVVGVPPTKNKDASAENMVTTEYVVK